MNIFDEYTKSQCDYLSRIAELEKAKKLSIKELIDLGEETNHIKLADKTKIKVKE